MRGRASWRVAAVLALGVMAGSPPPSSAQATISVTAAPQVPSANPHATLAAHAVRFPLGWSDDPAPPGAAWLLAHTVADQAAAELAPLGVLVLPTVDVHATSFTVLAPPAVLARASAALDSVLQRAPLDPDVLEARRTRVLANLAFQAGSPVADFDHEVAAFLAGSAAEPVDPAGTPESVAALDVAGLEALRRRAYRPATPPTPDSAAASPMPWTRGERRFLERDVTSAWIAVAWPAPSTVAPIDLEYMAFLLDQALDPTPPDPDRYGITTRIHTGPEGSMLLVEATVFPEAADRWEARILDAMARVAADPPRDDFLLWSRRRFRNHLLLAEAAPEDRALREASDLARFGHVRDLPAEIWGLDPDRLARAVCSLGEPRILVYGPDLAPGETKEGAKLPLSTLNCPAAKKVDASLGE